MSLAQLLPQFGNLAFTLIAFVVALSVIVAVHEYGHYIVGRWSGIHAEVFSLGFGPVLFSRIDRRGTRWQVAALPFGGYVKFLGDANAASVGSSGDVAGDMRRHTMLGAPLWARAATVLAGPAFNFVLAFVLFAGVIMSSGTPRDPLTVASLTPLPAQMQGDLRPGDEVLAVAGQRIDEALLPDTDLADATVPYEVRRDGAALAISGPNPRLPVVGSVNPGSRAFDAGVRPGDVVLAVYGEPVANFTRIIEIVSESDGRPLPLLLWRDGAEITLVVTPKRQDLPLADGSFETRWLLGIVQGAAFEPELTTPGLVTAAGAALGQIRYITVSSVSALWHIVSGAISTCNLSGPVGIAEASGAVAAQGAMPYVWFLGVLSAAIGLLNLFPVPVLDGGHLVFHLWEAVTGNPPSDGALRVLMAAGLAVILTLMGFAVLNDLVLCR
ncbi:MAG: RIP metalloprotease RseP [Rubellimicrobium sp.]|nr:RIP metalloprotease RseP [Rubellimicrobium sp.]